MRGIDHVLGRITTALRRTDSLPICDGKVRCPMTDCDLDIERCGQCPWVLAVSADGPAGGVVECRRVRGIGSSLVGFRSLAG